MNRRTSGLTLAQAIPGFLLYKTAEALSPTTLRSYHDHLSLWLTYTGDTALERISSRQLCGFLAWLRTDYMPHRLNGDSAPLATKTLRNYWVSLSAFFAWACIEFQFANPIQAVPAPRFEPAPVQAFPPEAV